MIVEITLQMHLKDGVDSKEATNDVLRVAESLCRDVAILRLADKKPYCLLFCNEWRKHGTVMKCFKCYATSQLDAESQFELSYGFEPSFTMQTDEADTCLLAYRNEVEARQAFAQDERTVSVDLNKT